MDTFKFTAKDDMPIVGYKWQTADAPKAIFQLIHGSIEHAMRYTYVAEQLVAAGYAVYSMDLRGHGQTAEQSGVATQFSKQSNGWQLAVEDIFQQADMIKSEHPNIPIFLFGHSMGSFLVRDAINQNGGRYKGAILSGTGRATPALMYAGVVIGKIFLLTGRERKSDFLHNLIYGELNKKMVNPRTDFDFLSRDEAVVDKYIADPWCGNKVTVEYAHELVMGVMRINQASAYANTPNTLPIYLFSGEEDPVGGEKCSFVTEVADAYTKGGSQDVQIKVYPNGRHEMLNEPNKDEVIGDLIAWMDSKL